MHIILLGAHIKVVEAGRNRMTTVGDVDAVIDDVAGMRHPLPADHKLIFGVIAKGIGHAAVPAADVYPTFADGIQQGRFLLAADAAHRVDRDHQIDRVHQIGVQEAVQ